LLMKQLQFPIVQIQKFTMHGLRSADGNVATIDLKIGDELNGNVQRLA
jgi:hypothetical protein